MNLTDHLLESARRWAAGSLESHISTPPDHAFSVHHMGVAAEHASKAYLASISPVLLAPAMPTTDDLLVLSGNGERASKQISDIRTAAGETAAARVAELLGRPGAASGSTRMLREARNGITHLGMWDREANPKEILASGIGYINEILDELSKEREGFWGDHAALSRLILEEAEAEIVLRYEEKVRNAARDFEEKVSGLTREQRSRTIASLEALPVSGHGPVSAAARCPACGSLGVAGGRDRRDGSGSWFDPRHFGCRVCDLALDGFELDLAGFTGRPLDGAGDTPGR